MPPTRRRPPGPLKPAKRITRHRIRTTTWTDLLRAHHTAAPKASVDQGTQHSFQGARPDNFNTVRNGQCNGTLHAEREAADPSEDSRQKSDGTTVFDDVPAAQLSPFDVETMMAFLNDDEDDDIFEMNDGSGEQDERIRQDEEAAGAADVIASIRKTSKYALQNSTVIALTLLCGSVRFTVQQYDIVRRIVRYEEAGTELPSYLTVKRKLLPHFLSNCFPQSTVKKFRRSNNHIPPEVRPNVTVNVLDDEHRFGSARVIYPTECAKTDVASLPFYRNIFECSSPDRSNSNDLMSIERAPIVRNRPAFLNATEWMFVETPSGQIPATRNDRIRFKVKSVDEIVERLLRRNNFLINTEERIANITGFIFASWCVSGNTHNTPSAQRAIDTVPVLVRDIISQFTSHRVFRVTENARPRLDDGNSSRQRF